MNSEPLQQDNLRVVASPVGQSFSRQKSRRLMAIATFVVLASTSSSMYAQTSSDPWQASQVMEPEALVKLLPAGNEQKPLMIHVGFPLFYRNGHIPGSIAVGPASKPQGIKELKKTVSGISRERTIVLYCGCCPWKKCPNIRPAFQTMEELGFRHVLLLYLEHSFQQDWIQKKFPTEVSDATPGH